MSLNPASLTPRERAAILEDATKVLVEHGWTQGALHRTTPTENNQAGYCVAGAIALATQPRGYNPYKDEDVYDDYDIAQFVWFGKPFMAVSMVASSLSLISYNDNKAENVHELIDVMLWRAQEIRDGR